MCRQSGSVAYKLKELSTDSFLTVRRLPFRLFLCIFSADAFYFGNDHVTTILTKAIGMVVEGFGPFITEFTGKFLRGVLEEPFFRSWGFKARMKKGKKMELSEKVY